MERNDANPSIFDPNIYSKCYARDSSSTGLDADLFHQLWVVSSKTIEPNTLILRKFDENKVQSKYFSWFFCTPSWLLFSSFPKNRENYILDGEQSWGKWIDQYRKQLALLPLRKQSTVGCLLKLKYFELSTW